MADWVKIKITDSIYPQLLKEIYNPPKEFWAKGDLSLLKEQLNVSMVGTRRCDDYGLSLAEYYATKLSNLGATIVSGMALGIDSACHKSVLKTTNKTIGVLACGPDKIYPTSNYALRKEMEEKALLITPYDFGSGVTRDFTERNRIISGLSLATVIVEAPSKSGAMITASTATEQNRDVYTFAGDMFNPNLSGNIELLSSGAQLLFDPKSFVEHYISLYDLKLKTEEKPKTIGPKLNDDEKLVYKSIIGITSLEMIIEKTSLIPQKAISILTKLEILGLISQMPGKRFKHTER